jgi:hypothetical protein
MADDLKYGYKGAEPTQSFGNNTGVFNPNDINNLIADNKWTSFGQLELIETQTVSGVASVEFTNLKTDIYNVHFMTMSDYVPTTYGKIIKVQLAESGTYETASVYQFAEQYNGLSAGSASFGETKSTGTNSFNCFAQQTTTNGTNDSWNGYCYLYNLGDSSKYSFSTYQTSSTFVNSVQYYSVFGSSVLPQASQVDKIKIFSASGNITNASISLYGIRYS